MRIPRLKFKVLRNPVLMTWFQEVSIDQYPAHLLSAMTDIASKEKPDQYLFYTLGGTEAYSGPCRICQKKKPVAAADLCFVCFHLVTKALLNKGIIVDTSDIDLRLAPKWVRALSRLGIFKLPVLANPVYVLVRGREDAFCNELTSALGLGEGSRVKREGIRYYIDTR
jgi:hypothetical protein